MLNKAIIMGRLTRDPELRYTQSNTPVATFAVAVERRFKSREGERETDFINCVAWRQQAEFVSKWFQKGRMICVVGSIQTRKYTDKDGNNRTATEVVADEINFCGDSSNGGQGGSRGDSYGGGYQSRGNYGGASQRPSEDRGDVPVSQLPEGDFSDLGEEDDDLPF